MEHEDTRRTPASQQQVTFGILALLFMVIVGATTSGTGRLAGTLVLAVVSLTFFVLAVRTANHEPK